MCMFVALWSSLANISTSPAPGNAICNPQSQKLEKELADGLGARKSFLPEPETLAESAPLRKGPHNSGERFLLYFGSVSHQPPPANPVAEPLTKALCMEMLGNSGNAFWEAPERQFWCVIAQALFSHGVSLPHRGPYSGPGGEAEIVRNSTSWWGLL